MLAVMVAACNPDDDNPQGGGNDNGNGNGNGKDQPTGDTRYYPWNTTGEYVVPEDTAHVNPNFFYMEPDEATVLSIDVEKGIASLRFDKEVPKLYEGAIVEFYDHDGLPMIYYVTSVDAAGNEANITFRHTDLSELFFNQEFVFTDDPSACYFQADNVYLYEEPTSTRGGVEDSKIVKMQGYLEMAEKTIQGLRFTHETNWTVTPDVLYKKGKPEKDENGRVIQGRYKELGAVLRGSIVLSDMYYIGFSGTTGSFLEASTPPLLSGETMIYPKIGPAPIPTLVEWDLSLKASLTIDAASLSLQGGVTTTLSAAVGAVYKDGDFKMIHEFKPSRKVDRPVPEPATLSLDAKFSLDPKIKVLPLGIAGVMIEPCPYFEVEVEGTVDHKFNFGYDGQIAAGFDIESSFIGLNPLSVKPDEDLYTSWYKLPTLEVFKKVLLKFPSKVEPDEKEKDQQLIMGYQDERPYGVCVTDQDYTEHAPVPSRKAQVKVETLSDMPEGTTGTFQTDDGFTCHDVTYYETDDHGNIPLLLTVPGPMQYDYRFRTSVVGHDTDGDQKGDPVGECQLFPINRFKSYKATYLASECEGTTTITVNDYGRDVTEKGVLVRNMYFDGMTIVATYLVDSSFDELFEITDMELGADVSYVTAQMKYYAAECLIDPVLDRLDYIRWDQEANSNYQGYTFSRCFESGIDDCVRAQGPKCSFFFETTDITYWHNIPVKVATGYLDEDMTQFSYLTLQSYEIIDDSSEDRQKNGGDTGYESSEAFKGDGDNYEGWGGGIDLGGGGEDSDEGYYIRVDEEPENWEGEYLIVSEKSQDFLPGDLTNIYGNWNGQGTHAENGRIFVTTANETSYFTISRQPDGHYNIYSTEKDYYLGCKDRADAAVFDKWAEEPIPHTITYDVANHCVLIQSYYNHTLCYDEKYHQYIYSTWAAYSAGNYLPIQLYKRH